MGRPDPSGDRPLVRNLDDYPPRKLTYPLKMGLPNRKVVFQPSIFRRFVDYWQIPSLKLT